ncbi:hypothetical protein PF005_g31735 [Phytophthora fragariae]|uniref:Uncharacterized protein n=1 Tax=Phytophthora fragariae TaxID=53985 RepID=A0A6A3V3E7_9STRA|nr:hypothetical protein PF005_g31735 [Phytophthora fragariae]
MVATEEVPKPYAEATTRQDQDEWKKAIASELESLIAQQDLEAGTQASTPAPDRLPLGVRVEA